MAPTPKMRVTLSLDPKFYDQIGDIASAAGQNVNLTMNQLLYIGTTAVLEQFAGDVGSAVESYRNSIAAAHQP